MNDNQKLGGSAVRPRRQQLCTSTGGFASDGEGVGLERIAYVRGTVRMTLDGQLADRTARAQSQAALYRELLNYPLTPELRQHVTTRLTQLQQIDPSFSSSTRASALSRWGTSASGPTSGQAQRRRSRRARSAI